MSKQTISSAVSRVAEPAADRSDGSRLAMLLATLLALGAAALLAGCAPPPPGVKVNWDNPPPDNGPASATQSLSSQGGFAGQTKPLPGSFNN